MKTWWSLHHQPGGEGVAQIPWGWAWAVGWGSNCLVCQEAQVYFYKLFASRGCHVF